MSEAVSVVIPAYNAAAFLPDAIQSALSQTLAPLEILVVDDGSTDDTGLIAQSFGLPVRCITQNNQGLSMARNSGILEAKGDLIALLDADDFWLPEKLARQEELLRSHPNAVACFTSTEYIDQYENVLRQSVPPQPADLVEGLLLHSCIIGPPSAALIRRSAFDRVGLFDRQFSQCADWDMWLRLVEAGPIVYDDCALVRYRVHDTNMSKNISLLEQDTFRVLKEFFMTHQQPKYLRLKNQCYSNHWLLLSGSYLHTWLLKDSLRCLLQGLRRYPLNITRPLGFPARWLKRLLSPGPTVS